MSLNTATVEKPRPSRAGKTLSSGQRARRVFLIVHLWIGLILGLWFSLMGITGSIVAWRFDISAYEWRSRFPIKTPPAGAKMISLSQAVVTAQKSFPDMPERALTSVRVPRGDLPFYIFPMGQKDGVFRIAAVDPYTGEAYSPQPLPTFITWFEELHTQLLLGDNGNTAIGILSFFTVFLLLSGLWLWWPSNPDQLKQRFKVKWNASVQRRLYDLHNVMGIYLYPFLLVTVITAVQMVAVNVLNRTNEPPRSGSPSGERSVPRNGNARGASERGEGRREAGERGSGRPNRAPATAPPAQRGRQRGPVVEPVGEALPMDTLYSKAVETAAGFEMVEVGLPQRPTQPFRVLYRRNVGLTRYGQLYVNPYTGQVIEQTPLYNEQGSGKVTEISQGLHYGSYFGFWSKLVYTVAGLLPLGLFITGLTMWWRKKKRQLEVANSRAKVGHGSSDRIR